MKKRILTAGAALLLLHTAVLAALVQLMGREEFVLALFILMSIDELLLCGQPGRAISRWLFGVRDTPAWARVVLFLLYLAVFFVCLIAL